MLKFKQFLAPKNPHHSFIYPTQSELDSIFEAIINERENRVSGYYALPFEDKALKDSHSFLDSTKAYFASIENLVIIGIGGSSLGLKAIDSMLSHLNNRKNLNLYFLEHTDPILTTQTLDSIDIKDTHFIAISKSGTTIETASLLKYVAQIFDLFGANKAHLTCITDKDSPLFYLAESSGVSVICIDANVGGRFSVLSSVGILPLLLLGYDVRVLLDGAKEFMASFFQREQDHILQKAFFLAKNYKTLPINVLFSYSSIFRDFNAWYMQLWAESLGKLDSRGNRLGLTPVGLLGSIDQHSFLQLIIQGVPNKSVTFLSLDEGIYSEPYIPKVSLPHLESSDFVNGISFLGLLNLQKIATLQTLQSENIPLDSIILQELSEKSVGALIVYFELLASCAGVVLEINTYDQPGVEFGKRRLKEMF